MIHVASNTTNNHLNQSIGGEHQPTTGRCVQRTPSHKRELCRKEHCVHPIKSTQQVIKSKQQQQEHKDIVGMILLGMILLVPVIVLPYALLQMSKHSPTKMDNEQQQQQVDGYFQGIPVSYRSASLHSTTHCVGENFGSDAWMYRSCQFRNLCYDMDQKKLVLFQSLQEKQLLQQLQQRKDDFVTVSTLSSNTTVSLGAINPKWQQDKQKLEWFPTVVQEEWTQGYYELPMETVWVPFHSFAAFNPGHLLWDDFLPIYTLLSIFGLTQKKLLLTRYILESGLWATCDFNEERRIECNAMFRKFLPAMGVQPEHFATTHDITFDPSNGVPKSNLVCSRYGAAGLGMISDHGLKQHGWTQQDYKTTHNVGRGATLRAFRDYMAKHLNVSVDSKLNAKSPPFKVTFSLMTSKRYKRDLDYQKQIERVKQELQKDQVEVQAFRMEDLDVASQARIAAESSIFITFNGGGAVTATFLSRGASLIVYYDEQGGVENSKNTQKPAHLDWDLLNNAGYFRTHWLPLQSSDSDKTLDSLVRLIRSELDLMQLQTTGN